MKLYLCEKPNQAKDIAPFVGARNRGEGCIMGDGVAVTWCIGHLLEQAKPEHYVPAIKNWNLDLLPVIPEFWHMDVKEKVKSQFKVVAQLLKQATLVVIATDADREGEVIAREVLQLTGYRGGVSRLWLKALDADSIKKGLSRLKPEAETRNLYFSGLGRARSDWLTGMNVTMALTTAFGSGGRGGVLHCGRVQTPVLGLIVRRERAIANFKPKTHYVLDARFEILGTVVPMDWVVPGAALDADGHCVQSGVIEAVAKRIERKVGRVSDVASTPEKELAPLPYYLGSLQKEGSRRFGLKAQGVLDACQALYEKHKATTYPRTDCEYLPESMFAEVPGILQALVQVDASLKPLVELTKVGAVGRCFNDKKMTAHHAIIPTANANVRVADMSKTEQIVYEMIRRRFIAQFLGDHLFTKTVLSVVCESERFTKTGKATVNPGWKRAELQEAVSTAKPKSDDAAAPLVALPTCKVGDQALNVHAASATKKTEPPKRYNEGTLIAAMESIDKEIDDPRFKQVMQSKEKAGIGTEATRGAIIEGLMTREYVVTEKKSLLPAPRGVQLIELLEKIAPQLVDPVLTAHWEERLSQVEAGKVQLVQFEGEIKAWLSAIVQAIKEKAGTVRIGGGGSGDKRPANQAKQAATGPQCPSCGKGSLRQINGSKGVFWGCSGFREGCKATFQDDAGKPALGGQRVYSVNGGKQVSPAPAGAPANASTGQASQPVVTQNLAGTVCTTCGQGKLQLRNMSNSPKQFWGCSGFPACRHFAWAK